MIRKEKSRIVELHTYKNGKPIGNWYLYDETGDVVSHGFGVEGDKFKEGLVGIDMRNSFLSINQTGDFAYATFYLDNKKVFEDPTEIIAVSKSIFDKYAAKYKLENVFIYDRSHEYTIFTTAVTNDRYKIDTIKGREKLTVFIK